VKSSFRFFAVALLTVLMSACQKSEPSSSAPAASAAPVPDDQLATPADFDESAANEITPENAEQKLGEIEKQIAE